jgi:hypothetical protein
MGFDEEFKQQKLSSFKDFSRIIVFGLLGLIVPVIANIVATFKGISDLSMFNSSLLYLLSILIIVLLLVKAISSFNNNAPKSFVFGVVFTLLNIISIVFNLSIYFAL